ncbi:hypothetical protein [Bacteroides sp. 224]|uniref:hypothetical protein n=1 Tax=Bacteroides sp. 224 TaxID=2302936 RepID=UPI0013D4FBF2|nr:hypothetical protein [Bacteroides sp. 224]NDV65213.1 hypothetical protein [Bacteroides sp. 224]
MPTNTYPLSTFLQFLKLGICLKGPVEEWGRVETICACPNDVSSMEYFIRKTPEQYLNGNRFFRKQLGIGIYLHDYYLFNSVVLGNRRLSTFIVVISTCRLRGAFSERLYYLKVTNNQLSAEFKQTIMESMSTSNKQIRLRRSFGSIRKAQSHDNGPLAVNRKMK